MFEAGTNARRYQGECVAILFAAVRERNYRIRQNTISKRCCAPSPVLESILLNLVVKIVLQRIPSQSGADMPDRPLGAITAVSNRRKASRSFEDLVGEREQLARSSPVDIKSASAP